MLPSVVNLLRHFPQFYEVIVRCARKTEVSLWEYLFSIVGDPKALFNHCLENNELKTATSFLIIIQTLEPFSISSKLQVNLLERTLEAEDFELCGEIVRYLTSVGSRLTTEMEAAGRQDGTRSGLIAISAEEEQAFYVDILISRHARKLMQHHRIRTLGKLASTLNFPLVEWLRKERYRTALITDMMVTFKDLHKQFDWPWTHMSPRRLSEDHKNSPPLASPLNPVLQSALRRNSLPSSSSVSDIPGSTQSLDKTDMNMVSRRVIFDEPMSRASSEFGIDSPRFPRRRAQSLIPDHIARRVNRRLDVENELR